jgi:paraquat-inducible protein A
MTDALRLELSRALLVAGFILYLPANIFPVMTITITGDVEPLTVMGGVRELYHTGLLPVAGIVFLASVVLPLVKMLAAAWILALHGSGRDQARRMAVHRFLVRIGTWAMIDIFLLSVLTAVGQLGILASVRAEIGAVYYAVMIICVLFAVDVYKPHMIWQEAASQAK